MTLKLLLAYVESKMSGQPIYLVVSNVDASSAYKLARAKNCLAILPSLNQALKRAATAAQTEGHSSVGVVELDGTIVGRAYALDAVRHFYYTDPIVAGDTCFVVSGDESYLYYRTGQGFQMSESVLSYPLVDQYNPDFHTQEYYEKMCECQA